MVPETDARAILRAERINYWLGVGAQPSPKVAVLIRKYGSNGTHISKQLDAIERLGGRRSKAIEAARIAAAAVPKPVLTTPAAPPADAESAPSNDSEASAEATAESDESGDSAADES
jgi:small subunit ribosomal protein S16